MSAAGSAPEIERTLREQGEAIAALQKLLDERTSTPRVAPEIPYIDADAIGKLYALPTCPRCEGVQDFQLRRGEELEQGQRITVSGARRGLLTAYQLVLEFLAVGHSLGNLDCAQRGKELFVRHGDSPALEDVVDQLDVSVCQHMETLTELFEHLLCRNGRRSTSDVGETSLDDLARYGQFVRQLRRQIAEEVEGVAHHKAPCVARAVTRYVTGAGLAASWWLQRKAWVRRAAGFSRSSGTTTVVPGPENSYRVPAPGSAECGDL